MTALAVLLLSTPFAPQTEGPGRLIPTDATVLVRLDSPQGLADLVNTASRAAGEQGDLDGAVLLAGIRCPLNAAELDLSRPVWLAVTLDPATPVPAMTWVAAPRDAEAARRLESELSGSPFAPRFADGCVGLSMRPHYTVADEPNPLVASLAPGLVSLHVDLAGLLEAFGPLVDMGMKQARLEIESMPMDEETGLDVTALMEAYLDGIDVFLDSVQSLGLVLERDGSRLALSASLLARPGSAMDGWESDVRADLRSLAGYLQEEDWLQLIGAWDQADFQRRFGSFVEAALEAYPEPIGSQLTALWDEQVALSDQLLPGVASSLRMDATGVHGLYALRARDPAAVAARMDEILGRFSAPENLFAFEPRAPLRADERSASLWSVRIDWDALARLGRDDAGELRELMERVYGKEPHVAVSAAGDAVVIQLGSEPSVRRAFERAASPTALRPALARLLERSGGGTPGGAYSLDLGSFLATFSEILAIVAPGEALPAPQGPLELGCWFSIRGALWSGGVEADLEQILRLVAGPNDKEEDGSGEDGR